MIRSVLALVCAGACSALGLTLSADDEAARNAALQWLRVVDSGNYQDAALMISEQVRGSQDWLNYLAAHRAPLGAVNHRHVIEVKHASTIPGDPVLRPHAVIRFKTSFERKRSVRAGRAPNYGVASKPVTMEEVVMTKMGCCWEVWGYRID